MESVGHLVPLYLVVGGDPANGDPVVAPVDQVAHVHCCNGMGLARAEDICSHTLHGCGEVDEERVAVAALLAAVDDAESLVYGKDLRVEHFLVAEVVAASDRAARQLPDDGCPHPPVVEARPIRPDVVDLPVLGGRDDGALPTLGDNVASEPAIGAL